MSLSVLYMHELHHRMTSFRRSNNVGGTAMAADILPRRASLSELDEENVAQAEQDVGQANNRLASSTMA